MVLEEHVDWNSGLLALKWVRQRALGVAREYTALEGFDGWNRCSSTLKLVSWSSLGAAKEYMDQD